MSKYNYDTTGDKIGVILVHGFVHDDIRQQVCDAIGDYYFTTVCYLESGYTITLVTTQEIDEDTAHEWICDIYDNEDDIPDLHPGELQYPVFVGIQEEPIEIVTGHDGYSFDFLGGIWGYEEDTLDLYGE